MRVIHIVHWNLSSQRKRSQGSNAPSLIDKKEPKQIIIIKDKPYSILKLSYMFLQVLSAHFRAYIQALEKLQLDIATSSDLIGVETRNTSLFSRGREPLKNRSAVFALGERRKILKVVSATYLLIKFLLVPVVKLSPTIMAL